MTMGTGTRLCPEGLPKTPTSQAGSEHSGRRGAVHPRPAVPIPPEALGWFHRTKAAEMEALRQRLSTAAQPWPAPPGLPASADPPGLPDSASPPALTRLPPAPQVPGARVGFLEHLPNLPHPCSSSCQESPSAPSPRPPHCVGFGWPGSGGQGHPFTHGQGGDRGVASRRQ